MRNPRLIMMDLQRLGFGGRWLGASEISQLPKILMKDEKIEKLVYGIGPGGPAIMVATDRRLLFVDKAFLHLTVEDVMYDSISSIECSEGPWFATIKIYCKAKEIEFRYVNKTNAHEFDDYVEKRMLAVEYAHTPYSPVKLEHLI